MDMKKEESIKDFIDRKYGDMSPLKAFFVLVKEGMDNMDPLGSIEAGALGLASCISSVLYNGVYAVLYAFLLVSFPVLLLASFVLLLFYSALKTVKLYRIGVFDSDE